tara:strand:- start:45375 stop:45536 length:162 start_codon:yes stop_codon:yes gene_type:complete
MPVAYDPSGGLPVGDKVKYTRRKSRGENESDALSCMKADMPLDSKRGRRMQTG